ncbi:MAG: hypothetical protein LJE85_06670 [Gammaproteobacteria bacterium]|nr:hypothetical protein [Gammaproteobacteria bacterium]
MRRTHVSPFKPTGKPMKGWGLADTPGFESEPDFKKWLAQAGDTANA